MPERSSARAITRSGMPTLLQSGMPKATTRITAAMEPRWRYALTRNRASPATEKEKSSSPRPRKPSMGRPARA